MIIYENDNFRFERYDSSNEPSFAIISQGDALDEKITLNLEENYKTPRKYTEIKINYKQG